MKILKDRDLFSVKTTKHERAKKKTKKINKVKTKKVKKQMHQNEEDDFVIKHVPISYDNVHVGQMILGSVLHVFKYEIIVSLPNRMTGHLPLMHLSKSYNDFLYEITEGKSSSNNHYEIEELYKPGHLLVTKIISVLHFDNGTSKITLSALPEDVNCELTASILSKNSLVQCAVTSEEENGYIMETGIRNIRSAFLSKKYSPEGSFGIGSVLLCGVKKIINDTEIYGETSIKVSAKPSFVNAEISLSSGTNVASIFPGTLVSGTVQKVVPEGLELSIAGFRGFAKYENLPHLTADQKDFTPGKNVLGRILYVTDLTSEIVCSLNAKLCSNSAFSPESNSLSSLSIDNIYSGTLLKDSSEEAYFALPMDSFGLCPKRNLEKWKKQTKKKNLQVGKLYKCRVTHVHLIDQVYNVTIESSEKAEGALFRVGQRVTVKIAELNDDGALVVISKTNSIGSVPKHHLTDSDMSHPEKKYKIGRVFNARILKYSTGKDPVLTLKTGLIDSKLPMITDASGSFVGTITLGSVVKIYKHNLLVEFFNDSKALVLRNDIPPLQRKDLNAHFQIGSIVKCKVTSYDDAEKRMFASLVADIKSDDDDDDDDTNYKNVLKNENDLKSSVLKVRDIVNCKIYAVNKDNVQVDIENFNEKGCIPFYHFADEIGMSKSLFRLLSEGDLVKNVVVFSKSKSNITLTLKPSVYHHLKELSKNNLQKSRICPSVVGQCFKDKILVTVLESNKKSEHIIPKDFIIRNKIDSALNIGIQKGQTLILSHLKSVKTEFCSYLDLVLSNNRTSGLQLLYDTLLQENIIRNLCSEINDLKLKEVTIGASYEGLVVNICKAGTLVKISKLGLYGVIHPTQYNHSSTPKINETLKLHVLNINYNELCLELTSQEKEFFRKKNHQLKVSQEAKCEILLAKKEYIIGRLLSLCPGQIIYLPSRRHINDFKGRYSYYEAEKQYDIVIEHVDEDLVLANLKVHTKEELLSIRKEMPSFDFTSQYLRDFHDDMMLDESHYTRHDFKTRATSKTERVTNWLKIKKIENDIEDLDKWKILQEDKFSQLDEVLYNKNVIDNRKERKKLKKKLGPIKPKKRKFNESFDENYDEVSNDHSRDIIKKDFGLSEKLDESTKRETKGKDKAKRRKVCNEATIINENREIIMEKDASTFKNKEINSKDNTKNCNNEAKRRKLCNQATIINENGEVFEEKDANTFKNKEIKSKDKTTKIGKEKIKKLKPEAEKSVGKISDSDNSQVNKTDYLKIKSTGFDWSGQVLDTQKEDDESSSDEEIENVKEQKSVKKLSKYEKSLKDKIEEKKTRELELERLDDEREPETALDFEEKIEQNPHSSAVWIEYISFHLENSETDKARAVASRALATIPATKEEERLALWNVSLRLEVMYGTEESVESSFKDALARNDELKIYYIMLNIYSNANTMGEADELIKKMIKKHSQKREVWIKIFLFYFKVKDVTKARNMLDKSLLCLPKSDHVEVISRFAQLELNNGYIDRGKTIFETLLGNFPKRLDIWNVYADLLLKHNDIQGARKVLERITGLKLKMKPMRNAFRKLLEFEKKHGTPQRIDSVKARVEEYVTSALKEEE